MVFLIEGVDGSGKSTVVKGLKEIFPEIAYIKESYPGDSIETRTYRLDLLRRHVVSGHPVVYDRATALDEFCYEPVIGKREPRLDWERAKAVLDQCVIIYLECKKETIAKRLAERGDEYITEKDLDDIILNYSRCLERLDNVYRIEVSDMDEDEVCAVAAEIIVTETSKNAGRKKRPKLAHIVPRDLLNMISDNQYQMSLAHLIKQDFDYLMYYRRMVAAGRYVLMDNGAAENSQLSLDDLYDCWDQLRPSELVLPDTLCDKESTLNKTKKGIEFFREKGVYCNFMAVPQGSTLEEWKSCAEELIQMPEVHCLGVSKFLTIETGDPNVRYKAVEYIAHLREEYNRPDVEVHLLGCDAGPSEPAAIFKDFDFVRGCDTALAYIYAQAQIGLEPGSKRPRGEMSFLENTLTSTDLLVEAMNRFDDISGVVNNAGDSTWF